MEVILGTRLTHAASFLVKIDSAILREVPLSGEVTRNTEVDVPEVVVAALADMGPLGELVEAIVEELTNPRSCLLCFDKDDCRPAICHRLLFAANAHDAGQCQTAGAALHQPRRSMSHTREDCRTALMQEI